MSIDTSGKWWIGTEPSDIRAFLEDYAAEGYAVHEFRTATCRCGSVSFLLDADDNEGAAKCTCTQCGEERFIADSEEYWEETEPERCICVECGSETMNVGVGFSLYEEGDVRWLYVGCRCTQCGILGCFAGWKIGYGPSRHLLDQV